MLRIISHMKHQLKYFKQTVNNKRLSVHIRVRKIFRQQVERIVFIGIFTIKIISFGSYYISISVFVTFTGLHSFLVVIIFLCTLQTNVFNSKVVSFFDLYLVDLSCSHLRIPKGHNVVVIAESKKLIKRKLRQAPQARFISNLSRILGVGRQLLARQTDGQLDTRTDKKILYALLYV